MMFYCFSFWFSFALSCISHIILSTPLTSSIDCASVIIIASMLLIAHTLHSWLLLIWFNSRLFCVRLNLYRLKNTMIFCITVSSTVFSIFLALSIILTLCHSTCSNTARYCSILFMYFACSLIIFFNGSPCSCSLDKRSLICSSCTWYLSVSSSCSHIRVLSCWRILLLLVNNILRYWIALFIGFLRG